MSFYGCRQKYSKMYRERQRKYNSSSNFEIVDKRGETSPLDFNNYSIATEIKTTSYWHVCTRTHTHTHTKQRNRTENPERVKAAQLCPTLCDPMDYTVHGILQARILEWVAFSFARGSSQPRDRTQVSLIAGGVFTSWAPREAHTNMFNWFLTKVKKQFSGG